MTTDTTPTRWMVWYVDDEVEPIAVKADVRAAARRIGEEARTETVIAVVGEQGGAATDLDGVPDDALSTETEPRRFIREYLHDAS